MPAGLGSFLLYVQQNLQAGSIVTVQSSGMGFGGGSRYRTPATTASRGLTVSPQMKSMKKFRRMR
jgi:hypothetical protein